MSSIRHEWYQTEKKVVVTVLIKNAKEKNYKVVFEDQRLCVTAKDYELDLKLFGKIDIERSSYKDFPFKIEITLIKLDGTRWESLEQPRDLIASTVTGPPSHCKKNWDSLAKEVEKAEEEEVKEEKALERLFQKIYKTSSPEVQWAMKKSYYESSGTVLSTNWDEVGKKKVDVKPPNGVEFHEWDKS